MRKFIVNEKCETSKLKVNLSCIEKEELNPLKVKEVLGGITPTKTEILPLGGYSVMECLLEFSDGPGILTYIFKTDSGYRSFTPIRGNWINTRTLERMSLDREEDILWLQGQGLEGERIIDLILGSEVKLDDKGDPKPQTGETRKGIEAWICSQKL